MPAQKIDSTGPRVALGILSAGKPGSVVAAIHQENIGFLTKLPGIGKKTAQRMILDLKDKLLGDAGDGGLFSASAFADGLAEAKEADAPGGVAWQEARDALDALGYTAAELDKAWNGLQDSVAEDETVDSLMKRALQQLFKG